MTLSGGYMEDKNTNLEHQIYKLYVEKGLSQTEVAHKTGASFNKVRLFLLSKNLVRTTYRRNNYTPFPAGKEQAKELRKMYVDDRLAIHVIAKHFGVPCERVRVSLSSLLGTNSLRGPFQHNLRQGIFLGRSKVKCADAEKLYMRGYLSAEASRELRAPLIPIKNLFRDLDKKHPEGFARRQRTLRHDTIPGTTLKKV